MLTPLLPLLCLGFSHLANASTQKPSEYLAIAPEIEQPTQGTEWSPGTFQVVKWDTTDIPSEAWGYTVDIFLGQQTIGSENLDLYNPLARNVPVLDGESWIQVPHKPDGDNYIVVLFGDSGNASPQFTIKNK